MGTRLRDWGGFDDIFGAQGGKIHTGFRKSSFLLGENPAERGIEKHGAVAPNTRKINIYITSKPKSKLKLIF
jgi:hypothetical protein